MNKGKFQKTTASRRQARSTPKTLSLPAKRPENSKTPVSRVGPDLNHHDTIATRVYYVLVDDPKEPKIAVTLEHKPQRFPQAFTTDAKPLYDSLLTFEIAFEPVTDEGKLTLKLERGTSPTPVELFTDVPENEAMLDDIDLLGGPKPPSPNRRSLDFTTLKARPFYADSDLAQKPAPHSSLNAE